MKNILEKSGLKEGKDFFLAFSPEREDPGRKDFTTTSTPKVVGGVSSEGGELAQLFYSQFIEKVVPVKDARTAEASKLTENIFRAVNIALVNELKMIYDRMGIDIWEVLDAASTKPFGFMRFNPGPGWGGHCIPLDPFYLTWKAKEYGINSNFIEHAGEINRKMPDYVIEKLMLGLNERRKSIKDSKILVIGVAYKRDIDDPRESPAFESLTLLLKLGAKVDYYDPYIPILPKMREWRDIPQMKSITLSERKLKTFDATIIVTDHRCIDYENLKKNSSLIVDTRGVFKKGAGNIIKA
jgi:UDP-N-acetyl-D-glucosamine dehydrogenase